MKPVFVNCQVTLVANAFLQCSHADKDTRTILLWKIQKELRDFPKLGSDTSKRQAKEIEDFLLNGDR